MDKAADGLRTEVLALPVQERARIASELLASLDSEVVDPDEADELWSVETQRRAAMLDTGEAGTLVWGEIEQRFAVRCAQRDTRAFVSNTTNSSTPTSRTSGPDTRAENAAPSPRRDVRLPPHRFGSPSSVDVGKLTLRPSRRFGVAPIPVNDDGA